MTSRRVQTLSTPLLKKENFLYSKQLKRNELTKLYPYNNIPLCGLTSRFCKNQMHIWLIEIDPNKVPSWFLQVLWRSGNLNFTIQLQPNLVLVFRCNEFQTVLLPSWHIFKCIVYWSLSQTIFSSIWLFSPKRLSILHVLLLQFILVDKNKSEPLSSNQFNSRKINKNPEQNFFELLKFKANSLLKYKIKLRQN